MTLTVNMPGAMQTCVLSSTQSSPLAEAKMHATRSESFVKNKKKDENKTIVEYTLVKMRIS